MGPVVFDDELEVSGHRLYPVALQRRQCRFHGFIQLVQQVAQIVLMAASLAAPPDLASGTLHDQWLSATGANECRKLLFHDLDIPVIVSNFTVLLKNPVLDN